MSRKSFLDGSHSQNNSDSTPVGALDKSGQRWTCGGAVKKFPSLCRQKEKNGRDRAFISWPIPDADGSGSGKKRYWREFLGPWGAPETVAAYERRRAEFVLGGTSAAIAGNPGESKLLVRELFARFLENAYLVYVKNGRATGSADRYRRALDGFADFIGPVTVTGVEYTHLKNWQTALDRSGKYGRETVNKKVSLVKSVFRWGRESRLVPAAVIADLDVPGLRRGKCLSPDYPQIESVPDSVIDATLPLLNCVIATMVRLQRLTGWRPEEVRLMRPCDIDRSRTPWVYRPMQDKTQHLRASGEDRPLLLGPQARVLLGDYLSAMQRGDFPEEFIFRPADAYRVSGRRPPKNLHDYYTRDAYAAAIRNAAKRAGVAHWTPYQIRHTKGTEVERLHGLAAAAAALGHKSTNVTRRYVDPNQAFAESLAEELG